MEKVEDTYVLNKYRCGYCSYEFKQIVKRVEGNSPPGNKLKEATSSQVMCSMCNNFLKTWEDGELIQEYKTKPDKRVYEINEIVK